MERQVRLIIKLLKCAKKVNVAHGCPIMLDGYNSDDVLSVAKFLAQKGYITLEYGHTLVEKENEYYRATGPSLIMGISQKGTAFLAKLLKTKRRVPSNNRIEDYLKSIED
ncbi:hypothetical protein H8S90_24380 [Olivibacter sp. SDN3]|uniref:hypothetical protein n=1 Tax=Olivibacter sp. SDN3 TaxID=2764720 RepID=UPI00165145AB|nr:hypothetical protein [Olivibacter sp. SDN3]QNL49805.1 hypothetical protein H8S90_24380 [Olivibacter sp. SDN3]